MPQGDQNLDYERLAQANHPTAETWDEFVRLALIEAAACVSRNDAVAH